MPPSKWEKRARFDVHDSQCAEIEEMKTEEMREQYDTGRPKLAQSQIIPG